MYKKHLFFICLILFICLISSCAERCDDFDYSITEWMPYQKNDKIAFSNNNIIDTLTVTYSEINHTDKIKFGSKCICENSYVVNISSATLDVTAMFYDAKNIDQSEIEINNEYLTFSEQVNSAIINGKTYINVVIFVNPNHVSGIFQQVMIAREIGIVAIISSEDYWVITDDSQRQVEPSQIDFVSSNC
jgi:hypothetical protein